MEMMIIALIKDFVKSYQQNKRAKSIWKEPIVAFANADDKRFIDLKRIVSPTHALPGDFLKNAGTVVAYFIPFERIVIESNIEGRESSRLWAESYIKTNRLILDINTYVSNELAKIGYRAAVIPATHNFDKVKLKSDWSHRHVASIAGLGSFGLNNMLITEEGCCGRVGSIVTDLKIEQSKKELTEKCLYKYNGSCRKCIARCVNGALKSDCYDRDKCYEMCLLNDKLLSDLELSDVCGKCMVGVPCSSMNPLKSLCGR